jgi:DNA-binding response OmpR family regulator
MAAAKKPIKLLIIDDDQDIVEILCLRFQKESSFAVETALDGAEGLHKAKSFKPDIVLLDVVMPRTDGWEVCRQLRSDPVTARAAIVAMTAQDGAADQARAREAQVNHVLIKPLDLGELVTTLRNAVPRR